MLLNTLWIGNKLGPVHVACLRSMMRQGHEVVLHSYGRPDDLPSGVKLFDAGKLMSEDEIFRHKETRSLTLASDRYRYRILREGMGPYVDCDMYFIRPLPDREYILGWQTDTEVNNAVLGAPHDSALVKGLLKASEDEYFVPPWSSKKRKRRLHFRKKIGFPKHVSEQPWGTIGPHLLTNLVGELGLHDKVQDCDIYYPLAWDQLSLLNAEGLTIEDLSTPRTIGIHIYNSVLKMDRIVPNTPIHGIINS